MYTEKLTELTTVTLSSGDDYKYVITIYEDITEIKYFETDSDDEMLLKGSFSLTSCHDVQVCKKIIELREAFEKFNK